MAKSKRKNEETPPLEKEKDDLPTEGIEDTKATEEPSGLRQRVKVQKVSISQLVLYNIICCGHRRMTPPL